VVCLAKFGLLKETIRILFFLIMDQFTIKEIIVWPYIHVPEAWRAWSDAKL